MELVLLVTVLVPPAYLVLPVIIPYVTVDDVVEELVVDVEAAGTERQTCRYTDKTITHNL